MNAIINIRKDKNWTSQDVCSKLRGIVGIKKIGHTGTLDPNATGVLPICVGRATKLVSMITDWTKVYKAQWILGKISDSYDITGNISYESDYSNISRVDVEKVISTYIGKIDQYPPIFSARKVNGKKLYEYARSGQKVEIKPKEVEIFDIKIDEFNLPEIILTIHCSKGTYIRSLCHDMGKALGCGGLMGDLKRVQVGPFTYDKSFTIDEMQNLKDSGNLDKALIYVDEMFDMYEKGYVKEEFCHYAYNGNALITQDISIQSNNNPDKIRLYDYKNDFLGIYELNVDKYKPVLFMYSNDNH